MLTISLENHPRIYWFLRGCRGIFSLPALILFGSFIGFCGFASEAGISREHAIFMTGSIWALPGMVLLVSSILGKAALPAAFITVSLSSMRLMPMVAALVPELRTRKTPTWLLLLVSHFIAVTAWVVTMQRIRSVPVNYRVAFFAGFGLTLTSVNTLSVAIFFPVVQALPPLIAGTLFFLTPIYFLTSIWASSRDRAGHMAMVAGLALAPAFHLIAPDFDILYTGLAGGTVAWMADRALKRKSA